ncbi:MAG TPA: hypothetical protein VFN13_02225 [Rudaea sp.]|nr:hypothetical protein [Rudaea sp.]
MIELDHSDQWRVFNTPSGVNSVHVGSADVIFTPCPTMTLKYTFTQGDFSGMSGTINEQTIGPTAGCR